MSAAALVAYERTDGRYSLHYSHWGGAGMRLVDAVTPVTPFGGSADRDTASAHETLAAVRAGRDAGDLPPVDATATLVNPAPVTTGLAHGSLARHVDPGMVSAVYVVSLTLSVRAYLPVRIAAGDPDGADTPDVEAVLVGLRDPPARDAERLRAWTAGARATLEALVDRTAVAPTSARSVFVDLLGDHAADREVIWP